MPCRGLSYLSVGANKFAVREAKPAEFLTLGAVGFGAAAVANFFGLKRHTTALTLFDHGVSLLMGHRIGILIPTLS